MRQHRVNRIQDGNQKRKRLARAIEAVDDYTHVHDAFLQEQVAGFDLDQVGAGDVFAQQQGFDLLL